MPASLLAAFHAYPPTVERRFPYGTAGFRSVGGDMTHVMHRSGMVAVLRSFVADKQAVGICITASHNPGQDNGVKLINPDGGMLCPEFEVYATEFINAKDPVEYFTSIAQKLGADLSNSTTFKGCRVYIGRDTRESSPHLFKVAKAGVESLGAEVLDIGIVTTPQVHFAVQLTNQQKAVGTVNVEQYYEYFTQQFLDFLVLCNLASNSTIVYQPERLLCDGANGVGAARIKEFVQPLLKHINVSLEVRNDGLQSGDELNFECGTEYVQKELKIPRGFGPSSPNTPIYVRCCSFDGDADRLVYHSANSKGQLVLVDGDKIGALYGRAIAKLLGGIIRISHKAASSPLRIGAVQTAYANGASTNFYTQLGSEIADTCGAEVTFEAACVKTGVKNLHRKAEEFDISIYFESNGHGTVMFHKERLESWAQEKGCIESTEFRCLYTYLRIFNQATGDAMADVLAAEAALKYLEMSFVEWSRLYSEIPCVQRKVHMQRSALDTLKPHPEHEKVLLQPSELQTKIDQAVSLYKDARAFVRPSGTEDVCRLYIEADTFTNAEKLCDEIELSLKRFFQN